MENEQIVRTKSKGSSVSIRWIEVIAVAAFFAGLTVLLTWPWPAHMGDSLYGGGSDGMYYIWLVGWYQKALFTLHQSPLTVPFLNFPEGWNLAYTETTPAMVLPALPFSLIGGPTFGYNASIFLSFVLSGLGVFLWIRRLTGNLLAALLAGVIYAFAPFRMSYFYAGLFPLLGTQWIPFFFWSLWELLEARRRAWKPAAFAALFFGLVALSAQYFFYMTLILGVIFVAGYLLLVDRRLFRQRLLWTNLGLFVVMAMPLLLIAEYPYLVLAGQSQLASRELTDEVRALSGSPTDFFVPSIRHFLWGIWSFDRFSQKHVADSTLYLGAVTLGLAVLGVFSWRRTANGRLVRSSACWRAWLSFFSSESSFTGCQRR
jgi:hypothetical protein